MINDAARNQSYEDALRRAVRRHAASDQVAVLDIGAGNGLTRNVCCQGKKFAQAKVSCEGTRIVNVPRTRIVNVQGL